MAPWVAARVATGVALALDRELSSRLRLSGATASRIHQGLLGWDAGWYEAIARHGYAGAGHASLRFFPLVPLLTRALSAFPGVSVGAALLVVSNAAAFVGLTVLFLLARLETGDDAVATRLAWFAALAPVAFTMVMGYAESTLLALSAGTMLALRRRCYWWAAGFGLLAGLTRPIGVLLVAAAAVEAGRGWRGAGARSRLARTGAVAGPVVGFGAFLGWVQWRYGDGFAPLTIQQESGHRGAVTDPISTLHRDASYLLHGSHLGEALHLPWVLVALALLVAVWRLLPASYTVFAAAVLAVALTASNLDGFERYALSAFPLVFAAALLARPPWVERLVVVSATAGLVGYAALAFANLYVP